MIYNEIRRKTSKIAVGSVYIGGDADVSVQSMTNTDTRDIEATSAQIERLLKAGCEIIRLAVPDGEAAEAFKTIKRRHGNVPLVADIHFDYRLALECAEGGADKIRINPGNIGGNDRVRAVADICRERKIPIRIGVNSGSVSREILAKYGSPTPAALAESALEHAGLLEKNNFYNIIISVKASNVYDTVAANRILSGKCQYPLHIGVTEAGTAHMGALKSAAGIGALLCDGIGDTVRVSLTATPESEVTEGIAILKAVGVRKSGLNIISCPTCGRTRIGLIGLVEDFERRAASEIKTGALPLTVALMGCAVNGPGEAREADFGIAGGAGDAVLFRRGKIIRKIGEGDIVQALIDEINGSF